MRITSLGINPVKTSQNYTNKQAIKHEPAFKGEVIARNCSEEIGERFLNITMESFRFYARILGQGEEISKIVQKGARVRFPDTVIAAVKKAIDVSNESFSNHGLKYFYQII